MMPPDKALQPTPQPRQRLGFPESLRSFGASLGASRTWERASLSHLSTVGANYSVLASFRGGSLVTTAARLRRSWSVVG